MQSMQVIETVLISVKPGAAAPIRDSLKRDSIDLEALTGRVGSPNGTAAGSLDQIHVSMQAMLDDGPGTATVSVNIQDSTNDAASDAYANENAFSLKENNFVRKNLTNTTKRWIRFHGSTNGVKPVPVLVTFFLPGTKA